MAAIVPAGTTPLPPPEQGTGSIDTLLPPAEATPGGHGFEPIAVEWQAPVPAKAVMHIDHSRANGRELPLCEPLPLGHPHEGEGFRFAVMQKRPVGIATQKSLQTLPTACFPVLLEHQHWVVGGCSQIPPTGIRARQTHKPMEEVIAGIGIRLNVVEQNPRSRAQLRQSRA